MNNCEYGCGKEGRFTLSNNKKCCENNYRKCSNVRKKNSDSLKGRSKNWKNGSPGLKNKGKIPWNKGKSLLETFGKEKAIEISDKIKNGIKVAVERRGKNFGNALTQCGEIERRRKISEAINKRYESGWMPKAGRCKKIRYISHIAGEVLLDGSWELEFAKYLDKENINWRRNKNKFNYTFDKKDRKYTPDFYLIDFEEYVEVKGYETDKDRAKWSQFHHELFVIKKEHIKLIKNGDKISRWSTQVVKGSVC